MSTAKRVWMVWRCEKCHRSHKFDVYGLLQCDKDYHSEWKCEKCRKKNIIRIRLETYLDYRSG